jgi:uncharacterized protein (DUF433 family)
MLDHQKHIEVNPNIMFGKPCIKNTRIPVDLILEKLALGDSTEDLLDAYPRLIKEDILASLLYAAYYLRNDEIIPIAA